MISFTYLLIEALLFPAPWAVECDVSFSTIGPARIVVFSDEKNIFSDYLFIFHLACGGFWYAVLLFVYLYSDILPFFHRDIYVINTFVCTYWLKSTRHCRVDMQFELFFSIYFYKWHVCITCCVMGRIWIMRQICVILVCHEYGHVWVEEQYLNTGTK